MTVDGVIKFSSAHHRRALPGDAAALADRLEPWRRALRTLDLIGHAVERYGGAAWGNLSARLHGERFVISGSQTGGLERCAAEHYALVLRCDLSGSGAVESEGLTAPSSEAMTHAAIYAAAPWVQFVFHGHSSRLWRAAHRLGVATTPSTVEYGTPAMAGAVDAIVRAWPAPRPGLLAMLGHEDGVVSWAASEAEAYRALEEPLATAE